MATFTTKKLDSVLVPQRTAAIAVIRHKIDPSGLASYPGIADIVEFFDIKANVRIVGGYLRVSADIGAATGTVTLQAKQGATTTSLTATLASTAAGSIDVTKTVPAYDGLTTIQILVSTAALDAAGDIEVILLTDNP